MRSVVFTVLMAVLLVFVAGQAHAFNLLVAVGAEQTELVVIEENGQDTIKVVKPAEIIVEDIEPAAG